MSASDRPRGERILKALVSVATPPGASRLLFGPGERSGAGFDASPGTAEGSGPAGIGVRGMEEGPARVRDLRRSPRGGGEVVRETGEGRSGADELPGSAVYARRWAARRRDLEMEAVSVAAGAVLFGTAVYGALVAFGVGGVVCVASGTAGTVGWAFSFGSGVVRELLEGETRPPE